MTESPDTDLRSLLSQVAAGQVAPEEASQRIAATDAAAPPSAAADQAAPTHPAGPYGSAAPAHPPVPPLPPAPPSPPSGVRVLPPPPRGDSGSYGVDVPIDRVVVQATAVKLVLIGDPTVTGASVEGPHVARRDGGALIIDTDAEPGFGHFSYDSSDRRPGKAFGRWRGGETVIVKIRPDLPVEVTVQAGSIMASRLEGGLRFVVEAGSLKAVDCSGPIDGRVEAGSAKLDWLLDRGESSLSCELGSVRLRLDPRSDVTVHARAELGSVELGGRSDQRSTSGRDLVVGAGTATLDIKVELGSAKVQVAS
ncbi:MAG TPA: hypothetical protein VES93_16750 [Ornithinibacter sp.]|nr:hypothetical protein [Ornithinibacter sp.]